MIDKDCIFCKIANGEIPSKTVYEDEKFRAILDISPASKGHTLILPKAHFKDITEADEDVAQKLLPLASRLGKDIQKSLGASGFNILLNTGASAGQTVFHLHTHIIPRYEDGRKILTWDNLSLSDEELSHLAEKIGNTINGKNK